MKYHLTADATFAADTLDDAFIKLASHISDLVGVSAEGSDGTFEVDTPKFFDAGDFELAEVGHEGILNLHRRKGA